MNRRQRRRRARLRRLAIGLPVSATLLAWGVGSLLPAGHVEEAQAVLPSAPEAVWGILTDLDGMPSWRTGLRTVERLPDGRVGIRWREATQAGSDQVWERVEASPPARLVIAPAGSDDRSERRVYLLERRPEGTALSVRDERRIENPIHRSLVWILGADRAAIDGLTRDLERRLRARRAIASAGGR